MAFEKETQTAILSEYKRMNKEIQRLNPYTTMIGDFPEFIQIRHELILTMIDGKVLNVIKDNNASSVISNKLKKLVQKQLKSRITTGKMDTFRRLPF